MVLLSNHVEDPLDVDKKKTIREYRKEADPNDDVSITEETPVPTP